METSASEDSPLVILNPAANRGEMTRYREMLRSRAQREGAAYVETTRRGEARDLARRAAEAGRAVVIVGGDGSIHEVVNGILSSGRRVPLGIVAAGSGNDYAWNTLKLPRDPPKPSNAPLQDGSSMSMPESSMGSTLPTRSPWAWMPISLSPRSV